MKIFKNENEMQEWLHSELKKNSGELKSIICNIEEFIDKRAESEEEHKIIKSFHDSISSLSETEILSVNENISEKKGEVLRPDFTLFSHSTGRIIIVELKNSSNAAREAGTELTSYAQEIANQLFFKSTNSIVRVIISSDFKTILINFIRNMIFVQNLSVLCLEPTHFSGETKLKIIDHKKISLNFPVNHYPPPSLFHSIQIRLYNQFKDGNIDTDQRIRCEKLLNRALSDMSKIEDQNGFAVIWRDNENSYSPYFISLVYLPYYAMPSNAPSKLPKNNFQKNLNGVITKPLNTDPTLDKIFNNILNIFSCEKNYHIDFENHMSDEAWLNALPLDLTRHSFISFAAWGNLVKLIAPPHANISKALFHGEAHLLKSDLNYFWGFLDSFLGADMSNF